MNDQTNVIRVGALATATPTRTNPSEPVTHSLWRRRPRNLLLAVGAASAAALLRYALAPFLNDALSFVTFYPLVLVVTMLAGLEAGIVAGALGLALGWALFVVPGTAFPTDAESLFIVAAFALITVVGIAVVNRMDQLTLRLRREIDRSTLLAARHAGAAVAAWQSRERLDTLIAQAPVGIIEFNLAGHLSLANAVAQKLLGRDAAALRGMSWLDLVRADERELVTAAVDRLISSGQPSTLLTVIDLPDGSSRTVRSHLGLARDPEGRPQAVLNILDAVEHAF